MLVVDMTISLFLRWPTNFVIFAGRFGTLPGTRVRLLMFPRTGQQGASKKLYLRSKADSVASLT